MDIFPPLSMLEMNMNHQAKRVKLEHSYAYSDDTQFPFEVSVKEKDPLFNIYEVSDPLSLFEENDVIENVKIEIDEETLIKTEPIEPLPNEMYSFEYLNVLQGNEHVISTNQPPLANLTKAQNSSEIENIEVNNSVLAVKNPLELMSHDLMVSDIIILEVKDPSEENNRKDNKLNENKSQKAELRSFPLSQEKRENLQDQIITLKSDLAIAETREKGVPIHLQKSEQRSITSEQPLEEENRKLKDQLQRYVEKEKTDSVRINKLNEKIQKLINEEHLVKSQFTKRSIDKSELEQLRAQLTKTDYEHKQMHTKCEGLAVNTKRLGARCESQKKELDKLRAQLTKTEYEHKQMSTQFESQKKELDDVTLQLSAITEAYNNDKIITQQLKVRVTELTMKQHEENRAKQDSQKTLLNEQTAKLKEADKELARQKYFIGSVLATLTHKSSEYKTREETLQKRSLEIASKAEELEKKERELANKVCEFCGF